MNNKDWSGAANILTNTTNKYRKGCPAVAFVKLSVCYRNQKNYTKARLIMSDAILLYPDDETVLIERSEVNSVFVSREEDIAEWQNLLPKVNKRKAFIYKRLAGLNLENGNKREAFGILKKALAEFPNDLELFELMAKMYELSDNLGKSISIYNKLISSGGYVKKSVFISLAKDLIKTKQYEKAESVAKRGWTIFNDYRFKVIAAEIYTEQDMWQQALKLWEELDLEVSSLSNVEEDIKLHAKLNVSVIKRIINVDGYVKKIKAYKESTKHKKYAIYTSYSRGYDQLKLPENIDNRFDYAVFTDDTVDDFGVFKVRPLPSHGRDNPRKIRYAKTHPHVLFRNYDAVIWVDASFLIAGDLFPLLYKFLESGNPIASTPHQHRSNIFEELEACIALKKDDPLIMSHQVQRYKKEGFSGSPLAENGILFFNLRCKLLPKVLETWWEEIKKNSKRDQLSFGYALFKNNASWHHIVERPINMRNIKQFVLTPHGVDLQVLGSLNNLIRKRLDEK